MIEERMELVIDRFRSTNLEEEIPAIFIPYFSEVFDFVKEVLRTFECVKTGELYQLSFEELQTMNRRVYEGIFEENYKKSLIFLRVCDILYVVS